MIWYVLKIKMFRGKWWIILIFPQRVVDLKLYKKLYNCKRTQLIMDTLYMFIVLFHKMRNYLNTNTFCETWSQMCNSFIPEFENNGMLMHRVSKSRLFCCQTSSIAYRLISKHWRFASDISDTNILSVTLAKYQYFDTNEETYIDTYILVCLFTCDIH